MDIGQAVVSMLDGSCVRHKSMEIGKFIYIKDGNIFNNDGDNLEWLFDTYMMKFHASENGKNGWSVIEN